MDRRQYHKKTLAAIVAASYEGGVEQVQVFERSVNQAKFISFLRRLRQRHPFRKIAIFMD